jgi:hypothetical protein
VTADPQVLTILLPAFGSAPIADLTPERIRHWVAGATAASAAATVRKNCMVLHQCWPKR